MKKKFFTSPKGPDRLWDPPNQMLKGYEKGGDPFSRVAKSKCKADFSPAANIYTKNGWSYTPLYRVNL